MPTNQEILDEGRKALEAQNKAAMQRTENVQPTPTQAEVDAAKLGTPTLEELDGKEDHGAPEEKTLQAGGAGEYTTRQTRAKKSAAE
jgi:hypothetical protein